MEFYFTSLVYNENYEPTWFASKSWLPLPFSSLLLHSLLFPFPSISSLFSPKLIYLLSPSSSLPLLIPLPPPSLFSSFYSQLCFCCDTHFQRHLNQLKVYLLTVDQSQWRKICLLINNFTNHLIAESHWFGCYHEFIPGPELLGWESEGKIRGFTKRTQERLLGKWKRQQCALNSLSQAFSVHCLIRVLTLLC